MKFIIPLACLCLGLLSACDNNENNEDHTTNNQKTNNDKNKDTSLKLSFEAIDLGEEITGMTELRFFPDGESFLILRKNGQVLHFKFNGENAAEKIATYTLPDVDDSSDCGLISAAIDPDYQTNGFVYFGYCKGIGDNVITRHVIDASAPEKAQSTQKTIMNVVANNAEKAWHNIGSMEFDAEKTMWVVFGENALKDQAQDPNNPLGAVVRIIPNRQMDGEGYEPAPNNPYAMMGDPAVYAVGLRSPWRAHLDSKGRLWIGDVGAKAFEEVNVLIPGKRNFGWPTHEGPCEADCDAFTDPVISWDRADDHPFVLDDEDTEPTSRRVVWVGVNHRPPTMNDPYEGKLGDKMLYGDFCTGWVRAVALGDDNKVASDQSVGHLPGVVSWGQAADGHLYVLTYGNCFTFPYKPGKLYRAVLKK